MKALKIITAVFSMIKGGISLVEKLMTGSARRKERERKAKEQEEKAARRKRVFTIVVCVILALALCIPTMALTLFSL